MHALVEQLALAFAHEALEALHEFVGLPLRDESARLHDVDEHHDLVEVKFAAHERVLHRTGRERPHVEADIAQRLEVAVDRLALSGNARLLQPLDDLRHG